MPVFLKSYLLHASLIQFSFSRLNELSIGDMLKVVSLPAYQLWITFESFMVLDPTMPNEIRESFLDLERQLVLYHIWQKGSDLVGKVEQLLEKSRKEIE
jgi:hypothetical protein